MNPKEFRLPSNFDGNVRLFPLPDLVLFPHNVQPLHIFESRYVDMMKDALSDDRLIAMATLDPDFESEYHGRPPISSVVCIGEVAMHKRGDDGSYNLALVGMSRARIIDEINPIRSFREARVAVIEEPPDDESNTNRRKGRDLARLMKRRVPETAKLTREYLSGRISLGKYTDVISFRLPLEIGLKLALLNEPDPALRAKVIIDELSPSAIDSGKRPFPPDFSEN